MFIQEGRLSGLRIAALWLQSGAHHGVHLRAAPTVFIYEWHPRFLLASGTLRCRCGIHLRWRKWCVEIAESTDGSVELLGQAVVTASGAS